ncbi:hybrid sensor histidine kinase/response regulator [Limnoglobus roseus]|uniref:histidine kinase n=1 Tax=Limnoglobus roseus TaxID=2598579 RepID=A0A5C1AJ37_9BACT|nr:PAS domain-containing protein [Limnoglobus roseus]QEL18675.1 PAS domain S-box protein [Limnoglobus roseus]
MSDANDPGRNGATKPVDHQRGEEALRRSEARYRALVEASSQAVWSWAPGESDGDFAATQRWWEALTGQTLEEQRRTDTAWLDVVHPDDRAAAATAWGSAIATGVPYDVEYRVRAREGGWRNVKARGIPISGPDGTTLEWVGTLHDVTEQRRAEDARRESEAWFRGLVTATSDVVYRMNPDWTEMRHLSGRAFIADAADPTRSWLDTYIPADERGRVGAAVAAAVREKRTFELEHRVIRVDGTVGWTFSRAIPILDPHGNVVEWFGAAGDVTDRKRAEAESAQLAEKLRLALDAGDLGTWEWDPATDEMTLSPRAGEIYRVAPGVPHGREELRHLIHPDDRDRARTTAARAAAARTDYDIEYRLNRTDGDPVWVTAHGRGVYGPAGKLLRVHGVVQDVTDRRRFEDELRDIRSRMEAALAAGAIGTWAWDVPNDRFYGDASLARLFSVPPAAVAGGPLSGLMDSIHPDDRAWVGERVTRVVESRSRYEADYRVTDGAGGWRWVHARGQVERDETGRPVRFPGVVIDVTDRKRAEEALDQLTAEAARRRKRLYEAVLSTTPDLAYVWGLDHRFLYANEGLLRMWGKTWDEAIGRNCLELGYEPWHAEMHDREIEQVRATKQPLRGEVPFAGTFGRRVYDYLLMPVLGADGEVEAVAGITRDVTDRQAMEQELRDQDRKKDDFIALLAHELRNPLAPIRNGLQVLRLGAGNPEASAKAREMMDRQLGHMVRLIDDLLDVSRINRNKMELRRARVSLTDVIASAVETARPALDAAGHELTVALPATPVVLDADLTRMAQVFSNLLTNSAKYTPKGGRVWLSAERVAGRVVVSVRDTGIGIPAESLPAIFDMFSQVDRSVEKATGGLGIGLALVKGLVEMHGGTVTAASAGEGQGTTFTVSLPEAERVEFHGPTVTELPPATSARRILVVDDNRDGAESMADMLRLLGHEVRTAFDGVEAVAAAEASRPDVILMDVGMPRLNGMDATRRIREQPWGKGITILALTGWGQENDREQSSAAGCDGHLVKPVEAADLLRALAEAAKQGVGLM